LPRQIDAVLLQGSIEGYRLLPALRGLFPRLPILDYLHFVTPDWMDGGFPRLSLLYRDCLDLTVTSCHQVKEWLITQAADPARLRVCPINVDPEHWRPDTDARRRMRAGLEISENEVVILYAARLEAQKQPQVFIESLHLLAQEGLDFRALVAGDGSMRNLLEEKIRVYQLDEKVHLLGAVAAEIMPEWMAAADILFLPSQNEGISQAIYEGMACGLVPVAADVGGQAELVTPECGMLIPLSSPEKSVPAYADALRSLIQDSAMRQQMGRAARNRITSTFTLDHMGDGMQRILAEAIDLRQSPEYQPLSLPAEELRQREARLAIEFLQARQETKRLHLELQQRYQESQTQYAELSEKYFALLQPRPASHWFYLWLRQVTLPLYTLLQKSILNRLANLLKKRVKSTWTEDETGE
jgi:glycosyltransferase involved in cell wall biosynthesis